VFRGADQLAAALARVAGARAGARHAEQLDLGEGEGARQLEPKPLERSRALDGDQRPLVRDVAEVDALRQAICQPAHVGLAVGRVHDHQVALRAAAVDDQIFDDAALFVGQQLVLRLAAGDPIEIVREQALQSLVCPCAGDLEHAHMRGVEGAAVDSYRLMLADQAFVEDRHLVAGEGDHAGAQSEMAIEQRRSLEPRHALPMLSILAAGPRDRAWLIGELLKRDRLESAEPPRRRTSGDRNEKPATSVP